MPRRFHRDQAILCDIEQPKELLVTTSVLGEWRWLHQDLPFCVYDCNDVRLGSNVDSNEPHRRAPFRWGRPGASEPTFTLVLVHARTSFGESQDTVRALNAGRGRQSL